MLIIFYLFNLSYKNNYGIMKVHIFVVVVYTQFFTRAIATIDATLLQQAAIMQTV